MTAQAAVDWNVTRENDRLFTCVKDGVRVDVIELMFEKGSKLNSKGTPPCPCCQSVRTQPSSKVPDHLWCKSCETRSSLTKAFTDAGITKPSNGIRPKPRFYISSIEVSGEELIHDVLDSGSGEHEKRAVQGPLARAVTAIAYPTDEPDEK